MKKVVITGSSGRIGRALHWQLSQDYQVKSLDLSPSSSTTHISNVRDYDRLLRLFEGADTVFHTAALHAPHVGLHSEKKFYEVNVEATEKVCKAALASGVAQIIFTSTTALYGYACQEEGKAAWVTEQTEPKPRTIYHRTKLQAESVLREYAGEELSVSVIRMSRCFPEPAPLMAVYRLHRGVDYRDVARAHIMAGELEEKKEFDIYIVSGSTPFHPDDCQQLYENPGRLIGEKQPVLALEFEARGWRFPESIDRVYDTAYTEKVLGWRSERGPLDVIAQFDNKDFEILPPS